MREKLSYPKGHHANVWLHGPQNASSFMHCHEDLEINLATRGRAAYLVKDQRYDLTAGTMIWLFPDQEHLLIEQSLDFQMWIVIANRRFTRQKCGENAPVLISRDPAGSYCVQLSEEPLRRLNGLYARLLDARGDAPRLNAGVAYALLESLAIYGQAEQRAPLRRVHPSVELAARLIHSNAATYSLGSLSAQVGLSPSRLSRLFKSQMGLTLVSYRQRRALERFLDLFSRKPNRKLMSIALEAGFGSYPQFHRVFTREMGRSPAQFLRTGD